MAIAILEVNTFDTIPGFVPSGVLYFTEDTSDLYIGTGSSVGAAVTLVAGGGGGGVSSWSGDGSLFTNSDSVGAVVATLGSQTANTVLAAPNGSSGTPTFRSLVVADLPSNYPWSSLGNASGSLTLANAGNATTFNQTSAVNWTWANTTAATSTVPQSSPILTINGTYWNGSASAADSWTIQNVVGSGTNGTSTLTFTHSGTTGHAYVSVPNLITGSSGVVITDYVATTELAWCQNFDNPSATWFWDNSRTGVYWNSTTNGNFYGQTVFGWYSGGSGSTSLDTGISRVSAGVVGIGTGAQGNVAGQLDLATILMTAASGAPTSAGTAGTAGEIIYYGGLLYFCSVTGAAGSATWNKLSMASV